MSARIYRPRAILRLTVPLPKPGGEWEPITYDVEPLEYTWNRNDHNHADTLEVSLEWMDAGVDPRWIAGATCDFYAGSAGDDGELVLDKDTLRFIGRLVHIERSGRGDSLRVKATFHDYTSFFLLARPFATPGIPRYDDTLDAAWARICEHVPGTEQLKDNIELRGLSTLPVIGSAVAARFRGKGQVPVQPNSDAWAVWQQCVGAMGLISFFDRDQLVIATSTGYYTEADPPRIVWGKNLRDFSEARNNDFALRGVGITSFDPISGRTLEAVYNPLAGKTKAKKATAKTTKKPAKTRDADALKDVDFFTYNGVTDQGALEQLARRVYEERSRQEIQGRVVTVDMVAETAEGDAFDLLGLGAGDTIEVRFVDGEDNELVQKLATRGEREAYLVGRGYDPEIAAIIAANAETLSKRSSLFYVKGVSVTMGSSEDGGTFELEITYCGKIDPDKGGTAR